MQSMISINEVYDIDKMDDEFNSIEKISYHFPTIDFKFRNAGNATAFLWQFTIKILEIRTDLTPNLEFIGAVETDNSLKISAKNNGWDTIYDFQIEVSDMVLDSLFPSSFFKYQIESLDSGETKLICCLTRKAVDFNKFINIVRKLRDKNKDGLYPKLQAKANWSCKDRNGILYKGQMSIKFGYERDIYVTPLGFVNGKTEDISYTFHSSEYSKVTYITMIDPALAINEKSYPISRKIPPGDVERFHIMIGAPISCYLRIKFIFSIDENKTVGSDEFVIRIWNPPNSNWSFNYQDGDELQRNLKDVQNHYPFLK
jgi:hypothetical protein